MCDTLSSRLSPALVSVICPPPRRHTHPESTPPVVRNHVSRRVHTLIVSLPSLPSTPRNDASPRAYLRGAGVNLRKIHACEILHKRTYSYVNLRTYYVKLGGMLRTQRNGENIACKETIPLVSTRLNKRQHFNK